MAAERLDECRLAALFGYFCLVSCAPGTLLLSPLRSRRAAGGSQPIQLNHAAHVVGQVLQPDACLGAGDPDAAHQRAAQVVGLATEHTSPPGADLRSLALAAVSLPPDQRAVASRLAVWTGSPCLHKHERQWLRFRSFFTTVSEIFTRSLQKASRCQEGHTTSPFSESFMPRKEQVSRMARNLLKVDGAQRGLLETSTNGDFHETGCVNPNHRGSYALFHRCVRSSDL